MFCHECGKENSPSAKFCKYCGTKLVRAEAKVEEKPKESPKVAETKADESETQIEPVTEVVPEKSEEQEPVGTQEQVEEEEEEKQETPALTTIQPLRKKSGSNKSKPATKTKVEPVSEQPSVTKEQVDQIPEELTSSNGQDSSEEDKAVEDKLGFFKRAGNFLEKWIYDVPVWVVLIAIFAGPLVYSLISKYTVYQGPVVGIILSILVIALFVVSFYGENAVIFRTVKALGQKNNIGPCERLWSVRFKRFFIIYIALIIAVCLLYWWVESTFGGTLYTDNHFLYYFLCSLLGVFCAILALTFPGMAIAKFIWNTTSWCPRCGHFHALTRDKQVIGTEQVAVRHDVKVTNRRGEVIRTEENYNPGTKTHYQKDWHCKYCGMHYSQHSTRTRENR